MEATNNGFICSWVMLMGFMTVVIPRGENIFYLLFFLSFPSENFHWFQREILMHLQFVQFLADREKGNQKEFCYLLSTLFLLCHLFHCQPSLFFTTLLSRKWQKEKNLTEKTLTKVFIERKGKVISVSREKTIMLW